jgi:putative membrane protein
MKVFTQGIALTLMVLACAVAIAQDTKDKETQTPAQRRADRVEARADARADRAATDKPAMKNVDKTVAEYFAGKLLLMDQSTIQLAQLAEERSTNEKVKQFAQMLVDEHTKCSEKLRESAPAVVAVTELQSKGITRAAGFRGTIDPDDKSDAIDDPAKASKNPDASERLTEDETANTNREDVRKRLRPTAEHQILAIDRQATENYIVASTEMLEKLQGQDFDMGFLGFTIGSHTWALAELKAMDSVGDEKLQKHISDATKGVEKHLMKALELSKEFESDSAQRDNTTRPAKATESAPVPK